MDDCLNILLYFIIYSFLGWVSECIYCSIPAKHWMNRGFLRGPYCPIYGFGALFVIWLLTPLLAKPMLVFLCGVIVTSLLEYITGYLLEMLFHTKWWDYSKRIGNINGRVCLLNSALFGLLSLAVMYFVHPACIRLTKDIPLPYKGFMIGAFLVIFLYDFISTLSALLQRNHALKEINIVFHKLNQRLSELKLNDNIFDYIRNTQKNNVDEKIKAMLHEGSLKLAFLNRHERIHSRLKQAFPHQHLSLSFPLPKRFIELLHNIKKNAD